jgi:hypothetical protein
MKDLAVIQVDDDAPERTRAILAALPRVKVRLGKGQKLYIQGRTHQLVILPGIAPYAHVTAPLLAQITKPDRIPLVVAERLSASVREELESAGCSYADGTGAAHIEGPGFLLHFDSPKPRRDGVTSAPRGIGVVGVRTIQILLAEPEREWTITGLAHEADVSVGEAHNVLTRLEAHELIISAGAGSNRRRRVANNSDLLDWLATVPAARKIHARLGAFLYAGAPDELITRLAYNAHKSGMPWAITGSAAARVMGVQVVTALPVVTVRVPARPGLDEIASNLDLERVETGGNLMLLADVGRVGTYHAIHNGPVLVAPAVRIWLDMLSEPRGADTAALFREAVLGS